jgi:uncharacterized protein (TIGR02145 family)
MKIKCLIGIHNWNGCKCFKCGKVRNDQHHWKKCMCTQCGKVRNEQHDLKDGLCQICGQGLYKTIKIGNQGWMLENLNLSNFRNGDPITLAKSAKEWEHLTKKGKPACCYYFYNPSYGIKFGKLYNWYAVKDPRGLAPEGWHIPSVSEWKVLKSVLNDKNNDGTKLKSNIDWADNGNGTNESGFSGLPGGVVYRDGSFDSIGYHASWWSSTKDDKDSAFYYTLAWKEGYLREFSSLIQEGKSVRCLKD